MWRLPIAFAAWLVWTGVANAAPAAVEWEQLRQGALESSTGLAINQGLLGSDVQLAGYLLPVDRSGDDVHSFLLVPIPGACSHMPTPAPNQIVLVSMPHPYRAAEIYEPVRVSGKLRFDDTRSQLFILDGVKVVASAYSIGGATVTHAADMPPPPGLGNPLFNRRFMPTK